MLRILGLCICALLWDLSTYCEELSTSERGVRCGACGSTPDVRWELQSALLRLISEREGVEKWLPGVSESACACASVRTHVLVRVRTGTYLQSLARGIQGAQGPVRDGG